jgi:hypothetical protein
MTVLNKVNEFNIIYYPFKILEFVCEIKNQVPILCLTLFNRFNEHVFYFHFHFMEILKAYQGTK